MNNTLSYQIALSLVPNIGAVQAKILLEHFGDAAAIFRAKKSTLDRLEGIGEIRARSIRDFNLFKRAEEEIAFIEKYKISPLFLTHPHYPKRLLNCYDPPTLLYYRGNADLNAAKIISIIGTRSNTEYGKQATETLLKELATENVLVVSGLAFGVDGIAHRAALKNNLSTIGVLAHGMDTIYPTQHASLAKEITRQGGLLTEFTSTTKPDKHNFPTRNRVVAGMSDATIVIETGLKGGSMITAELANGYNRDVFAFPGRTTDSKSTGCNHLIKNNKAMLLTDARELIQVMGWEEKKRKPPSQQKELFISLNNDERIIVDLLKESGTVSIDELNLKSNLSSSAVAAAALSLELQNVIASMPGKMYRLL
jgi:DNA processing protein